MVFVAQHDIGSGRGDIVRAVLGIDAAWTLTQPSGIALVVENGHGWRVVALAPSYASFEVFGSGETRQARPVGSRPEAAALLATCRTLCGTGVDLVAVDMPLSRVPIISRRVSDDAVNAV